MLLDVLQVLPSVVQVPVPGVGWQVAGVPPQDAEQHSEALEHEVPVDLHWVALQVLPTQLSEVHCKFEVQAEPAGFENGSSHLPPVQAPEQHCEGEVQES